MTKKMIMLPLLAASVSLFFTGCEGKLVEKVDLIPQAQSVTIGNGSFPLQELRSMQVPPEWNETVYGGDGETDMTELLQTILLRVTIAGAASAVALKLAGGGALKEVVRTAAGLLMLLALLQPLAGLHLLSWNWQSSVSQSDLDEMQARNMQTTMSTVAASIAKAVQQRAEEAGIPCTVNVEMANDADGLLQVDKVTVYYDSTAANRLSELQSLLTKECGVPAERQELIAR